MRVSDPSLKPIALEYLPEGMILPSNIYDYTGSIVILSEGATLSKENLAQLSDFNSSRNNIYVKKEFHDTLVKNKKQKDDIEQVYIEKTSGYAELKELANSFFQNIKTTSEVTKKNVSPLCDGVLETLETSSPSKIFEILNAPRPMDEYLQRHSMNVSMLNGLMGKWLGLSKSEIEELVLAGLVHDTGKTKIPEQILDAPRKLTEQEFKIVSHHPIFSYELLTDFSERVRMVAKQHHEKIDGTGYPDGLKRDEIDFFAKITAISDVYDAMVSQRSYKEGRSPFAILAQFASWPFGHLDDSLLRLFIHKLPSNFIGKAVLMNDETVGTIRNIIPNDVGYPIVDIDGYVAQTTDEWYCTKIIGQE